MTSLFDPVQAGSLQLANRIVMAPLTRNRSPNAIPTPLVAQYYAQRASAGLLITEATAISQQGQGYADVPGLYGTEQLDGWKRVTDAVHAQGGKIVVQLWHVGRISHVDLQPDGLAPVTPANDIYDAEPQPLFDYVVRALAPLGLAYVHVVEGATGGPRELPDRPFDYAALKAAYRQAGGKAAWMVNNGFTKALAEQALLNGDDLVAFGKPFISNPDLVRRLRENAPLNPPDQATFYGGGAKGYTDYPALAA